MNLIHEMYTVGDRINPLIGFLKNWFSWLIGRPWLLGFTLFAFQRVFIANLYMIIEIENSS
jgi:hypothetical protein